MGLQNTVGYYRKNLKNIMKIYSWVVICFHLMMIDIAVGQSCDLFYTTKTGDSLSSLADKYYGDRQKWKLIKEANSNYTAIRENSLPIDLRLYIPCIDDIDNTPVPTVEDQTSQSTLADILGEGITHNRTGLVMPGRAAENPENGETAESSASISAEAASLLEELLGEDIVDKKSMLDVELTKALNAIMQENTPATANETDTEAQAPVAEEDTDSAAGADSEAPATEAQAGIAGEADQEQAAAETQPQQPAADAGSDSAAEADSEAPATEAQAGIADEADQEQAADAGSDSATGADSEAPATEAQAGIAGEADQEQAAASGGGKDSEDERDPDQADHRAPENTTLTDDDKVLDEETVEEDAQNTGAESGAPGNNESLDDTSLIETSEIPDPARDELELSPIAAFEIEQLKHDLSAIQQQAKLEIEAMKSRMEELEKELQEAQRKDRDADLDNQQQAIVAIEREQLQYSENKIVSTEAQKTRAKINSQERALEQKVRELEIAQTAENQIASIKIPEDSDLENQPIDERASANESLMTILRLRLIETITSLKAELLAAEDSDSEKAYNIRSEIDKLESTFEEIESIAAEELQKEKTKVEQLEARLKSADMVNPSAASNNEKNNIQQPGKVQTKEKEITYSSCEKFPNLCKYLEAK